MKPILIFALFLLLSGCSNHVLRQDIKASKDALLITSDLTEKNPDNADSRSSSILGLHATIFIAKQIDSATQSAMIGIDVQNKLLSFSQPEEEDATNAFDAIKRISEIIQKDVIDLLNRNINRTMALDTYIQQLTRSIEYATDAQIILNTELENVKEDLRATKNERRSASNELKTMIKNKNFWEIESVKKKQTSLETQEATLEIHKNELEEIDNIIDDLVTQGQGRLLFVQRNRELLISGLRIPSKEDLQEKLF